MDEDEDEDKDEDVEDDEVNPAQLGCSVPRRFRNVLLSFFDAACNF